MKNHYKRHSINKCHSIPNSNKLEKCTYKKGNVSSRIVHAVIGIENKRNIILMLDVDELNTSDHVAIRIEMIYNVFCRPIGSYAMGVMSINQKSLQQVNIIQHNLMRYSLGIPYKTHIKNIMKAMGIIDGETMYLMEKCTMVKLLHRTE